MAIPIVNDNIAEKDEGFMALLVSNTPNVDVKSGAHKAMIIITDGDSEY